MDPDAPSAAILTPNPSSNAGGVERFSNVLADALRTSGWHVALYGPRPATRWPRRFGAQHYMAARTAAASMRNGGRAPDLTVQNGFLGAAGVQGERVIQVFHGTGVEHLRASRSGMPRREYVRQRIGLSLAEWSSGARADVRVAVSERAANEVRRHYRLAADAVIPNGVDTTLFAPRPKPEARAVLGMPEEDHIALFVGRTEVRKGSDLLMPVCEAAGWKLAVAGTDAPVGSLALGVLDPERLSLAYSAADCLLFPTRYEACSYVILEAIACGLPVLTTCTGWIPTLVRSVPRYSELVLPPDAAAFASALRGFRESDSREVTAAARAFVLSENSLETFAARWREVLWA